MARFCTDCGNPIADQTQKFCVACGGEIAAGAPLSESEQQSNLAAAVSEDSVAVAPDVEFPEFKGLEGEASGLQPLLSALSVPGWSFFGWVFLGFIDWLSLILFGAAAFFFVYAFYGWWKFHNYNATLLQTRILVRALRDQTSSDGPQKGVAQ